MVAALAGVESGTVTWSVLASTQDTNDADREPNFGSFRGAVLFTPSRSTVRRLLPTPYTIFLDPVLGNVGDDGILRDLSGLEGVVLVSPNATGIEETGWTWEASFQLNQREKVAFSFTFDPDETVDLTRLTPVVSSPGVIMTKGDTGTVAIGTVTTGATGSAADVDNVGTPTAAILNFVIPRGDLARVAGSSATSTTIGTGNKVFTTDTGVEAFTVGQYVRIASRANTTNFMAGTVTASAGTSLTVNVTDINGSGTYADWNINISGIKGNTGSTGATFTSRGAWATATAYAVRDIVTAGGSVFEVLTAHTSSGSAPTVATPGANYRLWAQKGDIGNTGPSGTITSATASGLAAGAAPTVTLGGTPEARTMAFGIPQGAQGIQGLPGDLTPVSTGSPTGTYTITSAMLPSTRTVNLSANVSIVLGTGLPVDKSGTVTLVFKQHASTGPYTVGWATDIEWAGDAPAPIMPTVGNAELVVHLFWTGLAWRAFVGGVFYP